ncbi:MAG: ribosome recycling factor [Candidatus Vogelbacteria bacterium CG10_big_fil_rev_8_21_14_0_10_45_14]|uniref:Ribosome recycling factor n=1 Tax=Candidatus Vogelbacteria bacterium CG10_big_fil_rev_8_21_14_0_10_45_14 TaxID=1975042 RepID=A0A2H0RJS2_9BACT|nr:MAG: ribosome recycling factor [Candidatus Vogelbacteria bacterium CG10_big_fil_rev_8_21_14_0_10_45_14]
MSDINEFVERAGEIDEWLGRELSSVRTGKASPSLLDSVQVESYGSKSPVAHVANITSEDARTLRVTPWDRGQVKAIESAIAAANLGVSTSPDDVGLRVIFPELSSERRIVLDKIVGEKLEEGRVSLRKSREEVLNTLNAKEKQKEISEDEKYRAKDELEKSMSEAMKKLDIRAEKKRVEISQ